MPERTLRIDQPLDVVWERLQRLATWEGIGGMDRLRDATHRPDGTLKHFRYSLDTPVGTVDDDAEVVPDQRTPSSRSMHVTTETKGLAVTIDLHMRQANPDPTATIAEFAIDARATNFLAKPLASTLRHTLESGIDREGERMVQRLEAPDD